MHSRYFYEKGVAMEIRVLRHFLEVAREGNITHAAARLHVTQPTLSRQLKALEQELGKKLFTRSNHHIVLTEEGMLLRRRAEDILEMVELAEEELRTLDDDDGGDVRIGCAETEGLASFFEALRSVRERHPRVRFHIYTSETEAINERLDQGLLDAAIIVQSVDLTRYNHLQLPGSTRWGLLVPSDDPLARHGTLQREDLLGLPLICSRQGLEEENLRWFGEMQDDLDIVATYDMLYNAALMTRCGIGYALGFEGIVPTGSGSDLRFLPLEPELASPMHIIWRRYQKFTPAFNLMLEELQQRFRDARAVE